MNEVKTLFKRMAFYYLLLALNIIPCANIISDGFPSRNVSTIYLLILCVCLIMYYSNRVLKNGGFSLIMRLISWLALLFILLRGLKYSVFSEIDIISRHIWYLYYVPMLAIPLLLLYVSDLISAKEDSRFPKGWILPFAITVILIITVLTNDLHQFVFKFNPGFDNWDYDYSYGIIYYIVSVWQFSIYLIAVIILVKKCSIVSSKRSAWRFADAWKNAENKQHLYY